MIMTCVPSVIVTCFQPGREAPARGRPLPRGRRPDPILGDALTQRHLRAILSDYAIDKVRRYSDPE